VAHVKTALLTDAVEKVSGLGKYTKRSQLADGKGFNQIAHQPISSD
jgi:hypothetical protein